VKDDFTIVITGVVRIEFLFYFSKEKKICRKVIVLTLRQFFPSKNNYRRNILMQK